MTESLLIWWETYSTLVFTIGVHMMLALSIYLTLACGLLSLGNAAFMGIGAYTSALLTLHLGWPFAAVVAAGAVLPALVALLIGAPTLRLAGVYLAMATLAFGEVVRVALLNFEITGGPLGLDGIPQKTQLWHILLALSVLVWFFQRLRHSKFGRSLGAIREDETAAAVMGIDVARYKRLAFVIGALIAGVAGALNAHYTFFLSPREYGFDPAVDILTMAVLGGTSSFVGPMLGAALLTILPEALRFLEDYRLAVNGLILIIVTVWLPRGLWYRRAARG